MTTYENAPPPDGWQPEPRCCPFADCWACEAQQPNEEHIIRGAE